MKIKQPKQSFQAKYIFATAATLAVFILASQWFLTDKSGDLKPFFSENSNPTPDSVIQILSSEKTFLEVLNAFDGYDIFLSVKDDAATKMTQKIKDSLTVLGSSRFSKLGFRNSYVALFSDGKIRDEKLSSARSVSLKKGDIEVFSAGNKTGNFSQVKLFGKILHGYERGLHLYIYNPSNRDIYHYAFDFYKYENPIVTGQIYNEFYQSENQLEIIIDQNHFSEMNRKRKSAVKKSILISGKEDLVPAKIKFEGKIYDVQLRLKGDWTDHLGENKWSFRIIMDGEETLWGMRKFSLHHPKARNFLGEWIFHELLKKEDVLNLKYDFLRVHMTVENDLNSETSDWGIYAIEEGFDKYLLERNKRREGVILKVDESALWEERLLVLKDNLHLLEVPGNNFVGYDETPVVPFSEGKVMRDSNLRKQFLAGRDMFRAYLNREVVPSEVFDTERLAKYTAICGFVGGSHALNLHNVRLYFNPINGKLEPIGFDANAWQRSYWLTFFTAGEQDVKYLKALGKELEECLSEEYSIQKIMNLPGLKERLLLLRKAFPYYNFDKEVARINRSTIRHALFPARNMHIFFEKLEGNQLTVTMEYFGRFPSQIFGLRDSENRVFGSPKKEIVLMAGERRKVVFSLDKNFQKLFVSKKMKRTGFNVNKDLEKVQVVYAAVGTSKMKTERIMPWEARNEVFKDTNPYKKEPNFRDFDFLETDEKNKVISCKPGIWKLTSELRIPEGYTFKIFGGTKINISHFQAQIVSRSPVHFDGSAGNPVEIVSETGQGSGLFVLETGDTSVLNHCIFSNLRFPTSSGWSVSGGVNFYNAPVKISNTTFKKSRSEDALNIIRSYFEMDGVVFSETKSDAFDGDFVTGWIRNSTFADLGNDGIDVSGSEITIENVKIFRAGDKGLSAGEDSKMTVRNVEIYDSEVAVAGKDQSEMKLETVFLKNNKLGFTAFQKKSEFGSSNIIAEGVKFDSNTELFLIEINSSLKLNGEFVETTEGVKERMYGVEFGKASQ